MADGEDLLGLAVVFRCKCSGHAELRGSSLVCYHLYIMKAKSHHITGILGHYNPKSTRH